MLWMVVFVWISWAPDILQSFIIRTKNRWFLIQEWVFGANCFTDALNDYSSSIEENITLIICWHWIAIGEMMEKHHWLKAAISSFFVRNVTVCYQGVSLCRKKITLTFHNQTASSAFFSPTKCIKNNELSNWLVLNASKLHIQKAILAFECGAKSWLKVRGCALSLWASLVRSGLNGCYIGRWKSLTIRDGNW